MPTSRGELSVLEKPAAWAAARDTAWVAARAAARAAAEAAVWAAAKDTPWAAARAAARAATWAAAGATAWATAEDAERHWQTQRLMEYLAVLDEASKVVEERRPSKLCQVGTVW